MINATVSMSSATEQQYVEMYKKKDMRRVKIPRCIVREILLQNVSDESVILLNGMICR